MEEKRGKYIPASVKKQTFSCPHCDAYAPQTWLQPFGAKTMDAGSVPTIVTEAHPLTAAQLETAIASADPGKIFAARAEDKREKRLIKGEVFTGRFLSMTGYRLSEVQLVENLHFSRCFACDEISIWRQGKLLFPSAHIAPDPNPDMPDAVSSVYKEASTIVSHSPRGAAALLRLAIEQLCGYLGHGDKKINTAIKDMVADGLPIQIQKALDTVRVVGNEAVHPGTIDMKDNQEVALQLFGLVNFIVHDRITAPQMIDNIYQSVVPKAKRDAIEKRDKKKDDES